MDTYKEHLVGDLVWQKDNGLGQIVKKYDIHKGTKSWGVYNYDIYWFKTGTTQEHYIGTTVTWYKKALKSYVARRRKMDKARNVGMV